MSLPAHPTTQSEDEITFTTLRVSLLISALRGTSYEGAMLNRLRRLERSLTRYHDDEARR